MYPVYKINKADPTQLEIVDIGGGMNWVLGDLEILLYTIGASLPG